MSFNLKRFYFDDSKLSEYALNELVDAFATGRMIAFLGSMATESEGYGGWNDLIKKYIELALQQAKRGGRGADDEETEKLIHEQMEKVQELTDGKYLDRQVAMTVVREALAYLDIINPCKDTPTRVEGLKEAAAEAFGNRNESRRGKIRDLARQHGLDAPKTTIEALVGDLRIRRFATFNYDLEIEGAIMVEPGERSDDQHPLGDVIALERRGEIRTDPKLDFRLARLMLNGLSVESDIRDRARPDRLMEFSVGAIEVDRRVMHLHGRATDPKTMIVGLRDYDVLYRKADPAKVPFDLGQKMLFAGNPVLFVGAGMSEPELNVTLQAFISNNPYRHFAPTFLLWSTSRFDKDPKIRAEQMWARRIDFFRRLGVLTIFDEDLKPTPELLPVGDESEGAGERRMSGAAYVKKWKKLEKALETARDLHRKADAAAAPAKKDLEEQARAADLALLSLTVSMVGRSSLARSKAQQDWRPPWRSLAKRLDPPPPAAVAGSAAVAAEAAGRGAAGSAGGAAGGAALDHGAAEANRDRPVALWGTSMPKFSVEPDLAQLFGTLKEDLRLRAVVAPSGSGKGGLAWTIASMPKLPGNFHAPVNRRLIINAGFSLDTDFILLAASRFLLSLQGRSWTSGPAHSREKMFESENAFHVDGGNALIILNGIERFFSVTGAPLSAELDHLLRRIARDRHGNVRWLFLGSRRIERYFRFLANEGVFQFEEICPECLPKNAKIKSVYLQHVANELHAYARKRTGKAKLGDFGDLVVLGAHGQGNPHDIQRTVLGAYLNAKTLRQAGFDDMAELAMEILRAMAFIGTPVEAIVLLHVPRVRTALTRDGRVDRDLLTDTLAALQDVALLIEIASFEEYPTGPKIWKRYGLHTAISAELRHQFGVPVSESKLSTSFNMSLFVAQPVDGFVPEAAIHEELGRLIDRLTGGYKEELSPADGHAVGEGPGSTLSSQDTSESAACLRAASAVIRSYYSTTGLLTMDQGQFQPSDDKDGVLLEHAERLETLLQVYRKLHRSIRIAEKDAPEARSGPCPFYPDDLVWILNELGVVYLAQGDLYSARRNFDQAMRVNRQDVEFEDHSHNWRRITMNQVFLLIERGNLTTAEGLLRDIEISVNARPANEKWSGSTRFNYIQEHFGHRAPEDRSCFHPEIMHEEVLITGLVLGHRALCHHLRGHIQTAGPLYGEAIAILRRLGENRGYAFFQRHYAQLLGVTASLEENKRPLRLAVAAAESVRQTDMAYHARINESDAKWRHSGDLRDRRRALRDLSAALTYGAAMDLYRIQVEAGIHLAILKLDSGDYESALEHATDALALASRYGLTLRKVSLRMIIGRVLVRRGDRDSGGAMIERAVEAAARFGYQRGVEAAQQIRIEEGLAE